MPLVPGIAASSAGLWWIFENGHAVMQLEHAVVFSAQNW